MFSDYALEFFELDEAVLGAVEGGGDGWELFLSKGLFSAETFKEIID
jgi:hypothetical protein